MKLLALETATANCSVALYLDGEYHERLEPQTERHGDRVLQMVDALLTAMSIRLGQLDAIAFGCGPGAFTGVRIAAGTAQGLALGAALPVMPISSLAALAQQSSGSRVLAALDARMGQVYWGAYHRTAVGIVQPVCTECLAEPQQVPVPDAGGWTGAGNGFQVYRAALEQRLGATLCATEPELTPTAAAVARLAVVGKATPRDAAMALPVYLRKAVST